MTPKTQISMKIFNAQTGRIDTDFDGKPLPPEKQFEWANLSGLEAVKPDDLEKAGNSIIKLSCDPVVFHQVRKKLAPGEIKEFTFDCELRPGAKNKISLFAVSISGEK